ncbi:NAD(P)H-dependent oxidoreductase subunit E [Bacilliculturomica massiliensis]|uniref:NAD(P)H-dependent oxidoreductase subunit E n=1 Tax=Bacilliculturomica massiliensis TaxID=1917867 RepID=UPI0013EF1735|nr:NAD(P)H-dependent oxidoreductase subunit E [Bacilliculturomica massiliensis]
MKELKVEICVCTECVMKGAMELAESVESLKKVKKHLDYEGEIYIDMEKCLGESKHGEDSPLIAVDGELIKNADSETVMEKIVEKMKAAC